jgi:hypothetical protein
MAISKVATVLPRKASSEYHDQWPVDEIGRNSVRPSTIPSKAAFASNNRSNARSRYFGMRSTRSPKAPSVTVVAS